jgi:hypothetical protein
LHAGHAQECRLSPGKSKDKGGGILQLFLFVDGLCLIDFVMRGDLRFHATKNALIEGLYQLLCHFNLVFASEVGHLLSDEIVQHRNSLKKSSEPLVGAKIFIREVCGVNMGVPLQSKKLAQFSVLRLKWVDDLFYSPCCRADEARLRQTEGLRPSVPVSGFAGPTFECEGHRGRPAA